MYNFWIALSNMKHITDQYRNQDFEHCRTLVYTHTHTHTSQVLRKGYKFKQDTKHIKVALQTSASHT